MVLVVASRTVGHWAISGAIVAKKAFDDSVMDTVPLWAV